METAIGQRVLERHSGTLGAEGCESSCAYFGGGDMKEKDLFVIQSFTYEWQNLGEGLWTQH